MILPDKHIHHLIDCLTRSNFSFAIYRLPWTDECYFVLQTTPETETLNDIAELNGKKGFVIAPFHISEEHPLVAVAQAQKPLLERGALCGIFVSDQYFDGCIHVFMCPPVISFYAHILP